MRILGPHFAELRSVIRVFIIFFAMWYRRHLLLKGNVDNFATIRHVRGLILVE